MIFRIFSLDNDIIIDENHINILEIHNKQFATKIIKKLLCKENIYDDEVLMLLDDEKELNLLKNSIVITDLFNIALNDKKLLNKLYDLLEQEIKIDEEIYIELNEINKLMGNLLQSKINQSNLDLEIDRDLKIKELLKFYNIRILKNDEDDILTDLLNYLDLIIELNLYKIIFIVNLKSYLNNIQLKEIYKYILYNEIKVLLIETVENKKNDEERKLIVNESFDDYYV